MKSQSKNVDFVDENPNDHTNARVRRRNKEKVRAENRRKFHEQKKGDQQAKLVRNVNETKAMLQEVRDIAKAVRPFFESGTHKLGNNWENLLEDQIAVARYGAQSRIKFREGAPLIEDGEFVMEWEPVPASEQIKARAMLIKLFPELMPEDAEPIEQDPIEKLAKALKGGEGVNSVTVEVDNTKKKELGPTVINAIGRIINGDDTKQNAADLTRANS